jgi:hypothetical protein
MKRFLVVLGVSVPLAVLLSCCLYFELHCPKKEVSHCNYEKLNIGMTVGEVEAILGAEGKEIAASALPRYSSGPVVQGETFFQWEGSINRIRVIVGVKDERICDKWYWEDSL